IRRSLLRDPSLFRAPSTPESYPLSLHDALPISWRSRRSMAKRVLLVTRDLLFRSKLGGVVATAGAEVSRDEAACDLAVLELGGPGATDRIGELVRRDRKSTRLNSSHVSISYAVFCLKKKKNKNEGLRAMPYKT